MKKKPQKKKRKDLSKKKLIESTDKLENTRKISRETTAIESGADIKDQAKFCEILILADSHRFYV